MRIALSTLAALSTMLCGLAQAQPHSDHGQARGLRHRPNSPNGHFERQAVALQSAAAGVHASLRDEQPTLRFRQLSENLSERATELTSQVRRQGALNPHAVRQFGRTYQRTRRALVDGAFRPSNRLLDRWDDVVSSWRRVRRQMVISNAPTRPPEVDRTLRADVRINRAQLNLQGRNVDDFFRECMTSARNLRFHRVHSMELNTQEYAPLMPHGMRPLSVESACGLLTLNAYPARPTQSVPTHAGRFGPFAFNIQAPAAETLRRLRAFVPRILNGRRVTQVHLQGERLPARYGLDAAGIIRAFSHYINRLGSPRVRAMMSQGRIEGSPFRFRGTRSEIRNQCMDFMANRVHGPVRHLTLGGHTRQAPSGAWNAEQACGLVARSATNAPSRPVSTVQVSVR